MTYIGPSASLESYAANIYKTAGLGTPPQANAPEVFLELLDLLNTNNMIDLAVVDTKRDLTISGKEIVEYDNAEEGYFETANSYVYESYLIFRRNLTNVFRTKELFVARIGAIIGFGK